MTTVVSEGVTLETVWDGSHHGRDDDLLQVYLRIPVKRDTRHEFHAKGPRPGWFATHPTTAKT